MARVSGIVMMTVGIPMFILGGFCGGGFIVAIGVVLIFVGGALYYIYEGKIKNKDRNRP